MTNNMNKKVLDVPAIQMISSCWECGRKLVEKPELVHPIETIVPLCHDCYKKLKLRRR